MAVKKKSFAKIGGFDLKLPISEDSDLFRRLKKIGHVKRINWLKVETSARRFNRLGLFAGLWDYSFNYFKLKYTGKNFKKVDFRAGSEIKEAKMLKIGSYTLAAIIFIFAFFAIPISPVHAKAKRTSHSLNHKMATEVARSSYFVERQWQRGSKIIKKDLHLYHRNASK